MLRSTWPPCVGVVIEGVYGLAGRLPIGCDDAAFEVAAPVIVLALRGRGAGCLVIVLALVGLVIERVCGLAGRLPIGCDGDVLDVARTRALAGPGDRARVLCW